MAWATARSPDGSTTGWRRRRRRSETETWESSNDLVKEYLKYDHGKDEGANIADLLLSWYKAGKILAFAPVDHTNPAEVRRGHGRVPRRSTSA